MNDLWELLGSELGKAGLAPDVQGINLRGRDRGRFDAELSLGACAGDKLSSDARVATFLRRLEDLGLTEAARTRGHRVSLRLSRELVQSLGRGIERAGAPVDRPLRGRTCALTFIDPNATKALHLGHLRNAALGMALRGALTLSGARVESRSFVADIGRGMCQAMAGSLRLPRTRPSLSTLKSDHYVGLCYLDQCERERSDPARAAQLGEPASLLTRWYAGDQQVRDHWSRVREWALEGQARTLERLGIRMDREFFESDVHGEVQRLVDIGLSKGVLEREPAGAVVYRSEREELSTVVLVEPTELPTVNARLLATISVVQDSLKGIDKYIALSGVEWRASIGAYNELLAKLRPCPLHDFQEIVYYEHVVVGGAKMSSSSGNAILIDDVLDRVTSTRILSEVKDAELANRCAVIAAAMYFLVVPPGKRMAFVWEHFVSHAHNPGWGVVEAYLRLSHSIPVSSRPVQTLRDEVARPSCASAPDATHVLRQARSGVQAPEPRLRCARELAPRNPDGPASDTGEHEAYRTAVLMAQQLRPLVQKMLSSYDPSSLARFLGRSCGWYLAEPRDPGTSDVFRSVLDASLHALGLIEPPRIE